MLYALLPVSLSLIVYVLVGLIILRSLLRGHRKGFKTDLYWFITNILFWVSFVILAQTLISRKFLEGPMILNIVKSLGIDTKESANIIEFGTDFISVQFNLDKAIFNNDALLNTVFAIAQLVVKIVLLPVYALVYHLIVAIIYLIFFKKHFKPKKVKIEKFERQLAKEEENAQKKLEKSKEKITNSKADAAKKQKEIDKLENQFNKYKENNQKEIEKAQKKNHKSKTSKRIGWITGAIRGFVSAMVFLSIFNSFINLLPTLHSDDSSLNASEEKNNEGQVASYNLYDYISSINPTLKDVCDYINEYKEGKLAHVTDIKVNGKTLDTFVVDLVFEGKSEDFSLSLHDEFASIIKIAEYACVVTNGFNLDGFDVFNLNDTQVDAIKNIFLVLSNDRLIKNLGEAAISVALSLEAVKTKLPDNYEMPEIDIDIGTELATIANMVEDVFELIGNNDLGKFDFNSLDPDLVESLIGNIASLQSVQIICEVGSAIAVDALFATLDEEGNITNQETLDRINNNLADVVWKDDITELSTLYRKYLELGIKEKMDDPTYQDEEGKAKILAVVTSIENSKFNGIIDTIFETTFLQNVLPDVINIVKDKYIPAEYRDLISPNIETTNDWENEIKALLSIIKDLTKDGKEPIMAVEQFSFSSFENISTRTIVDSELLTYAMIGILIDASNGEGLAGNVVGDFISIPSELKVEADATTHKYNAKWYSTNSTKGELEVMLDEIKNIASSVSSLDNLLGSITDVLDAINPDDFSKSSVLQYTISNLLIKYAGDFLYIPTSSFMAKEDLAVADQNLNVIKADEIQNVIEILTNEEIFNLKKLMVYNKVDEEGNKQEEITYEEASALDPSEYTCEFNSSLDIDNITGILTNKSLYDPNSTKPIDEKDANLNKLFGSNILRATISSYINEYAGDFIVMPSSPGSYEMIDVFVPIKENTPASSKQVKVLSLSESKNLVKTIDILDLDISSLSDDPLSIVDSFKDKDGKYTSTNTSKIFAKEISDVTNPDYSETFHATLSKFVFDFASDNEGNDFAIKIPNEAKDDDYLAFCEIDAFLKGMCALDVNSLVNGGNISIVSLIYDNQNISDAFDSKIIRFSITNYLETSNATQGILSIPTSGLAIEKLNYQQDEVNVLTKNELTNIFGGFKALIEKQYDYLNPSIAIEDRDPSSLSDDDLMDPSAKAIKEASAEMFKSVVITKLVSSKIDDMAGTGGSLSIIIPLDVYDANENMIKGEELTNLIGGLCKITGGGKVSEISIDSDNLINDLGEMEDNEIENIFASSILRASMTKSVRTIDALKIPHDVDVIEEKVYDKDNLEIDILTTNEIVRLVNLFTEIGSGSGGLDALDVSALSIDKLINMMDTLAEGDISGAKISGIFRATLSDKLLELNKDESIYVGIAGNFTNDKDESLIEYDISYTVTKENYENINYIKYAEIDKMFKSIKVLLGSSSSTSLTNLNGDSFTENTSNLLTLQDEDITTLFASDIMVSTMSVIISGLFKEPGTLKYLDSTKTSEPFNYTQYDLPRSELINFYKAIQIIMPAGSTNIDDMQLDFEGIVGSLDTSKINTLVASKLLSFNIKNYLIELNGSGFNNMLALTNVEHEGCIHNYNRYYYSTKIEQNEEVACENDLGGLLNSFTAIYSNEEFVKAFKDTQNANTSILTTKGFIDTICGNGASNVIIDSLPNMIDQFKSRVTGLVSTINAAIDSANIALSLASQPTIPNINFTFYVPDRFKETTKFDTFTKWQEYWYGNLSDDTNGYKEGQLCKFFNIISVATEVVNTGNFEELRQALNDCELTVLG